jgi:hypothetical protein
MRIQNRFETNLEENSYDVQNGLNEKPKSNLEQILFTIVVIIVGR